MAEGRGDGRRVQHSGRQHLRPEIQAPLVAGVPNGLPAEYKSRIWRLFEEAPTFRDGAFVPSDKPGLGPRFNPRLAGDW